ncbi:MAG: TonB family protein [Bacteroidetes bacterium]|jgi:TonB family protein|nr:TonB family protein [Bacteroidota bacterium]
MKKTVFVTLNLFLFFTLKSQNVSDFEFAPVNVGGKAEFKRVFEQELIYPKASLAKKVDGKVTISFVVNKDSTVHDIRVKESPSTDLAKEALRIFKLYQWVPATKEGEYVQAATYINFNFDSGKYKRICKERGFTNFKYLPKMKPDTSMIIYKTADQMPMYQKGTFALQDFIKENLEYPRQAQLSNIQGTVIVRFVVEPSGLPTNIGIEKSVGGGCDQEAERIIQMIKWYPAKIGNTLVRAQMTFPIYFVLNEDFKDNSAGEQK